MTSTDPSSQPAAEKNQIRAFDAYGREVMVPRKQWFDNVLLPHLKNSWDRPDDLHNVIIQALNDDFFAEMSAPAERLLELQPGTERSVVLLAAIYLKIDRVWDAERLLTGFLDKHPESGAAWVNLAKVHGSKGEEEQAAAALWRGLENDPNQQNGLDWYEAVHREEKGEEGSREALLRVAALPGSWRAQLWLARQALDERRLEDALALYQESLSRAGEAPVPTDLLVQISGDLGLRGHLVEALSLTEPHFDIAFHGIQVGNNLLKANLDLGRLDTVRELVNRLYAQGRPDWKDPLRFWEGALTQATLAATQLDPEQPMNVDVLAIDDPIWLPATADLAELFPRKVAGSPLFAFLGSTAATAAPAEGDATAAQAADAAGRMSRMLPLFLAEQSWFGSSARVRTLVPWVTGQVNGFVLGNEQWSDVDAAAYARQAQEPADYVVLTHVAAESSPWTVTLRLVRTVDAVCLGRLKASVSFEDPTSAISTLALEMLDLLEEETDIKGRAASALYEVPQGMDFAYYLLGLEQLLAVRCAAREGVPRTFLTGERGILDGELQLNLRLPRNVLVRFLLLHTLLAMKAVRPDILPEYLNQVARLQQEHPLRDPAREAAEKIFATVLEGYVPAA